VLILYFGRTLIVTVALALAPALSTARAVTVWVPGVALLHVHE